ncbi:MULTISPECIES: OmpH family outer membrane protein [Persephonella]|uniref:Outer membrane chaperone Skp n=1 Tax=Persephonella marina (strain DSM 14350 / EX-H1) TaxID=123214 RepID=C0QQK0_PERMH|nr:MULTISPECIES: OmpH family outer membrane protein [Persephonella]ACO04043.1 outer membrane chaperone Skp [Persephonella marina EX-H1]
MFRKVLSLVIFFAFFGVSLAEDGIVYIDIQKVVSQSAAGKEAQSVLEREAQKFQEEIQKKQQAGETQSQLQAYAAEKQQELMKKRQELAEKFMRLLQENIQKFSKEKGYTLVVDKQSLLYANPKYDRTDEFLKYFDKNYKKGSLKN